MNSHGLLLAFPFVLITLETSSKSALTCSAHLQQGLGFHYKTRNVLVKRMKTHQFSLEDEGVSLVISLTTLQSPPTPYVIKHAKNNCGKSYKHTSSKVVVFFLNKRAQIKLNISDVT